MITGKDLIEKMYSDYDEYEDTKLYSTGDDYLDDLLERAFCEGYEYAQREFGNKANKEANREWKIQQAKKDKELVDLAKKYHNERGLTPENSNQVGPTFMIANTGEEFTNYRGGKPRKISYESQLLRESRKKENNVIKDNFSEDVKNIDQSINYKAKGNSRFNESIGDGPSDRMKFLKSNERYKKQLKKGRINEKYLNDFVKDHKGAIIGGTVGAAALTAGGIALHRHNKKKKEEKNKKKDKKD